MGLGCPSGGAAEGGSGSGGGSGGEGGGEGGGGQGPREASLAVFTSAASGVDDAASHVPTTWRAVRAVLTTTAHRRVAPMQSPTQEQLRGCVGEAPQPMASEHDSNRTTGAAERFCAAAGTRTNARTSPPMASVGSVVTKRKRRFE